MVDYYKTTQQWNKVGFLLFLLILTILMLEFVIYLLKKYIFAINDVFLNNKENKKILNEANKKLKKSNINFYIDYIILKDWHIDFKTLKNLYKNKDITKEIYKFKKHKLLKTKKKLINDFKNN